MADAGAIFGGAGSGALATAPLWSIPGVGPAAAGLGALAGGALGLFGSNSAEKAAAAQRAALDAAMERLQEFSQQQYANRMQDLQKTMAFYQPQEQALRQLYAPGGTLSGTAAPPPPAHGMWGTMPAQAPARLPYGPPPRTG